MEVDSCSASSSDNETNDVVDEQYIHSASVRVDVDSQENALIIVNTLSVDKEPSRSNATRKVSSDGRFVLLDFKSKDRKSLQKSISNAMEMCELSLNALKLAQNKSWLTRGTKRPLND